MPNTDLAESILSLFAEPSRAKTIAGDFAEQAGRRGSAWFWWQVARTCSRLLYCHVSSAPVRIVGWGLAGAVLTEAMRSSFPLLSSWSQNRYPGSLGIYFCLFCWAGLFPFLAGLCAALRNRGLEIAVCAAVPITHAAMLSALYATRANPMSDAGLMAGRLGFILNLTFLLSTFSSLLAGVLVRRRLALEKADAGETARPAA